MTRISAELPFSREGISVQRSTRPAKGDIVVDLGPGAPATACRDAEQKLGRLPGVTRTICIPPRVYLTLDVQLLTQRVTERVLSDGSAYGSSVVGTDETLLVVFSSPNANKPLHLGHFRNNVLGMALANLGEAHGYRVLRASVLSDWGIHMCAAAAGYLRYGAGETPQTAGLKPDHFVGRFYVRYQQEGPGDEAHGLLARLERGDPELENLNRELGDWANEGVCATYRRIGSTFDRIFRERETLGLAKELVRQAVADGACATRPDGSVYVDLPDIGEITLLRGDGTTLVYAHMLANNVYRHSILPFDRSISLYGEQWKAGTDVMRALLTRLGYEWAARQERIHHGMVSGADGVMASREGRSVSIDDTIDAVRDRLMTFLPDPWRDPEMAERGALALLKHTFLRSPRVKPMRFDFEDLFRTELAAFGRIVRQLAGAEQRAALSNASPIQPTNDARALLLALDSFPAMTARALRDREPRLLARYLEKLCGYAHANHAQQDSRLWQAVAIVIRRSSEMLGIDLPVGSIPV